MSAKELRLLYSKSFRNLPRNTGKKATFVVAFNVAQLGLVITGVTVVAATVPGWWGIALMGVLAVYAGTRLRALNNIVHECSHNTFATTRESNRTLGRVCASVLLGSFEAYREEHLTHHMHLGDYDHDLDLQGIKKLRLHDPLTLRTICRHAVTPLIGRHLPCYLNFDLSARDGVWPQLVKFAILCATAGGLILAPWTTLIAVIVPRILVYTALNYWTDCLDHAGLLEYDDELQASRNILAPAPLRSMFFPRNDCFHLVHHLFPQVPSDHLEACHHELMQADIYARNANAVRGAKGSLDSRNGPLRV